METGDMFAAQQAKYGMHTVQVVGPDALLL